MHKCFSDVLTACSRLLFLAPLTLDDNFAPNTYQELIKSFDLFEDDLLYTELCKQEYLH